MPHRAHPAKPQINATATSSGAVHGLLLDRNADDVGGTFIAQVGQGWQDGANGGMHVAGGHSVDDPEPKYGMAVTGLADPGRLLRIDGGRLGLPISLTKPLGVGVPNSRHKATGEVFPQAVAAMTTLNRPPGCWSRARSRAHPSSANWSPGKERHCVSTDRGPQ